MSVLLGSSAELNKKITSEEYDYMVVTRKYNFHIRVFTDIVNGLVKTISNNRYSATRSDIVHNNNLIPIVFGSHKVYSYVAAIYPCRERSGSRPISRLKMASTAQ